MKSNNFTFSILPFSPSRFTLHASPFFRAAVTQEFPLDTCNPFIPNKPNFKTSRLNVTLDMIRTYNDNCPKKHKKSKPNPNPIQTQFKPNPNPIQTRSKPNPNPIFTPNFTFFISHFTFRLWRTPSLFLLPQYRRSPKGRITQSPRDRIVWQTSYPQAEVRQGPPHRPVR